MKEDNEAELRQYFQTPENVVNWLEAWRQAVDKSDPATGQLLLAAIGLLMQRLQSYGRGEENLHVLPPAKAAIYRLREYMRDRKIPTRQLPEVDHLYFITERSHLRLWRALVAQAPPSMKVAAVTTRRDYWAEAKREGLTVSFLPTRWRTPPRLPDSLWKPLPAVASLRTLLQRTLQTAYRDWESIRQGIDRLQLPDTVTLGLGNSLTHEGRYLAYLALQRGWPTWSVQHGAIGPNLVYRYLALDRFCVYSEQDLHQLQALGHTGENVVVTGDPAAPTTEVTEADIQQRNQKLELSPATTYVLVAWSGYGHMTSKAHYFQQQEAVLGLAQARPDLDIVFKLHRKEKPEDYPDTLPPNVRVIPYSDGRFPESIHYWLTGAQVLITGNSTVATEAMRENIPVVSLDIAGEYGETDFLKQGPVPVAHDQETLQAWLSKVTDDSAAHQAQVEAQRAWVGPQLPSGKLAALAIWSKISMI